MKKFLITVFVFSLLSVVGMYSIDYMIGAGLKKTESRLFKSWNKILKSQVNADVIILGNSRAYRNFNAVAISDITGLRVWNLGMDAYPFNIQHMKYDIYRSKNIKPKLLLINVDYSTLRYKEITYEREQFFPYVHDSAFQNTFIYKAFPDKERHIPLLRYFGYRHEIGIGLAEYLNIHHFNDNENNGFWAATGPWNGTNLDNLINKGEKIKTDNDERVVAEFNEFIRESIKDHVKVILVFSPFYKKALKVLTDNTVAKQFFEDLARREQVVLLDYTDDDICDDMSCFENATHLNEKGAKVFSARLANDLARLPNQE